MEKILIIAEAGVNHNGNIKLACELIDVAKEAGADIVKFQTFKTEKVMTRNAPKAQYQLKTTSPGESQFEMAKKFELSYPDHKVIYEHCKKRQITFLSSPFDLEAIDFLIDLGLDTIKIPSGEITNLPYIRKIGKLNKNLIVSSGMALPEEIESFLEALEIAGTKREKVLLLHCNTAYPTPYEDSNLRAIRTLAERFRLPVGFSDHTPGIEISLAAVGMGAVAIEKHFTTDKNLEGPDQKASLTPDELKALVSSIRNIEKALGTGVKAPSPSESKNMIIARKSIVANRAIREGEIFTEENLYVKRPGTGISPMRWDEIVGRKAKRSFTEDELIEI